MNVLFLMFAFPDLNKSFNLYTAIVEQFHKEGHKVFILAPETSKKTGVRKEKGIDVLRVRALPIKNVPNYLKGISNLLLPLLYKRALNKFYKDQSFDLIITATPPITFTDLASRLKRKHMAKLYLILRDIFPQNAVDMGFMKKGGYIYNYFRSKEKRLYIEADKIGCMSQGNIDYVLNHNLFLQKEKLHVLQNYQIKNEFWQNRDESINEKYGLKNKFVVVFGGNMGKPQQLENVIKLAKECEEYKDVVFLLLGGGLQKKKIEDMVSSNSSSNVILLETIPKQDYQRLIKTCDIGLISLHQDFTVPNIPSKCLDYLNLGIPVLASVDKATDFGLMLELDMKAGLSSLAGDIPAFKKNFDRLYWDTEFREICGKNGRNYFERYLTPDVAYKKIIESLFA